MLLNEMEIFYQVVELGSFSKAADKLGVSKSFISKKINALETTLRCKLLNRSTRKLSLTDAGENFYRQCTKVIEEANKGFALVNELHGKPAGRLKISAPPAFAQYLLPKIIAEYQSLYPDVTFELDLSSQFVDLVKAGFDLALRSGKMESSNLITQKIASLENCLCASKKYLKEKGEPITPNDLEQHNFALYSLAKNAREIHLQKGQKKITVIVHGSIVVNQIEVSKQLLLKNLCLAVLPKFMIETELKSGEIKIALPNYSLPESSIYAIYPDREFLPTKVTEFIALLKKHI